MDRQAIIQKEKMSDFTRRSLAMPHRAICYFAVKKAHIFAGIIALISIIGVITLLRKQIWNWQITTWKNITDLLGLDIIAAGYRFYWEQYFVILSWRQMVISTAIVILVTWLILRSPVVPTIKGLYLMIIVPIFLFCFVVFLVGEPPVGVLDHVGPEWLYGELILWFLIPLLYALFVFPIPFSLIIKLMSLVVILLMSIVWRTLTPIAYIVIAVFSKGLLAIPAWMILGPWADYLYVIPAFSATLCLYKGDKRDDLRA
ncbi:MAG: hypothetical protein QME73_05830 [Bacillota bacterium]|nr:hypothetical protein [Bacillota bacterium]